MDKGTILLVDDQPNALRVLSAILQEEGYSVREALDVDKAIAILAGHRVDAIITDVRMPVRDGFHLWSERYDREMKDVFEIQDDITRAIVGALEVQLPAEDEFAMIAVPMGSYLDTHKGLHCGVSSWRRLQTMRSPAAARSAAPT